MSVCYLFTEKYPFAKISFIHTEVLLLSKKFDEVHILTTNPGTIQYELPPNVKPKFIFDTLESEYLRLSKWKKIHILLHRYFILDMLKNLNSIKKNPNVFATCASRFIQNSLRKSILKKYKSGQNLKTDFNYVYWFDNWATILGLYKLENKEFRYISRAHGFDVFKDQNQLGFMSMRYLQLKSVDKVFSASRQGELELKAYSNKFAQKITTVHLGTQDQGFQEPAFSNALNIISFGRLVGIKRIDAIADALMHLNSPFTWYHVGADLPADGTLRETIHLLNQREGVKVVFLGILDHDSVFDFYRSTKIDFLLSLSSSEGLPVSMMEAISFGIPVISTDVGGCKEIVNSRTGVLLPLDSSDIQIAEQMEIFKSSVTRTKPFRQGVRSFWQENFQQNDNLIKFLNAATSTN